MSDTITENIFTKLVQVQQQAKAPRAISGKFGKSRSAEQILEAYKPICNSLGLYLFTSDEITQVGERNYIIATATIVNSHTSEMHSASAAAWENQVEISSKTGGAILDTSQVSGKTSSYAKKYALQNLFAVDDTKDADNDHVVPSNNEEYTPEEMNDVLKRAKAMINDALEKQDYTAVVSKKAFITRVLKKSTIETLDEADLVMDALENEA